MKWCQWGDERHVFVLQSMQANTTYRTCYPTTVQCIKNSKIALPGFDNTVLSLRNRMGGSTKIRQKSEAMNEYSISKQDLNFTF